MYLSKEEERMYEGERGPAFQKAMEILVALGDVFEADRLIDIGSAHISGVSYKSAREIGLKLDEKLAEGGASFQVPTTLNPIGIDLDRWKLLNMPEEFANKQIRIVRALRKMGGTHSFTCIPYLIGNLPRFGEHIAWSESSLIIFGNSVLGARTNREGNPSALAGAIVGKTPRYGYHLKENRYGNVVVDVEEKLKGTHEYGALGYYVGGQFETESPVFTNIPKGITIDELKCLGTALATSGGVAIYHVTGITPEAKTLEEALGGNKPKNKILVGHREIEEVFEHLCTKREGKVDYVNFGCPHASLDEVRQVSALLEGRRIHPDVKLWVCTALAVKVIADRMGYTQTIEKAGGQLVCDTCGSVCPSMRQMGFMSMATNSVKLAQNTPPKDDIDVFFGSMRDCIDAAIRGQWKK